MSTLHLNENGPGWGHFGKTRRLGHSPLGALRLRGYFLGSSLPRVTTLGRALVDLQAIRADGRRRGFLGGAGKPVANLCALLKALTMAKTMRRHNQKLMHAPMNAPKSILVPGTTSPEISVAAAGNHGDKRVDDVVGKRGHDGGECAADNHADSHVHHVAAIDEFPLNSLSNAFMVAPRSCGARVVTAPDEPDRQKGEVPAFAKARTYKNRRAATRAMSSVGDRPASPAGP